jgi:hypothetical protein
VPNPPVEVQQILTLGMLGQKRQLVKRLHLGYGRWLVFEVVHEPLETLAYHLERVSRRPVFQLTCEKVSEWVQYFSYHLVRGHWNSIV